MGRLHLSAGSREITGHTARVEPRYLKGPGLPTSSPPAVSARRGATRSPTSADRGLSWFLPCRALLAGESWTPPGSSGRASPMGLWPLSAERCKRESVPSLSCHSALHKVPGSLLASPPSLFFRPASPVLSTRIYEYGFPTATFSRNQLYVFFCSFLTHYHFIEK